MINYDKIILNKLLDKYEQSKSFTGQNSFRQSFSVKIEKLFPEYEDHSEYTAFATINEAADGLCEKGFVTCKKQRNGVLISVSLVLDSLDQSFVYLNRTPKKDTHMLLKELLNRYIGKNEVLSRFCNEQIKRIEGNKSVGHFDGDFDSFENILKVLSEIFSVQSETLQRDFSIRVLGDSKAFEKIKNKVVSILFEYGDFPEKETLLEELNIIRNPGHVYFKGAGRIKVSGQIIDFSGMCGDLSISSSLLKSIEEIKVTGDSVMTIENLTTFNAFSDANVFAIYLGGYHNADRRDFIRKVHEQNQDKQFLHYGDIDAGGFYILRHLREKTGVDFHPYNMNVDTLKKHVAYTKSLTENDKNRLQKLLKSDFHEVVSYMLENDCKLEQEALDV